MFSMVWIASNLAYWPISSQCSLLIPLKTSENILWCFQRDKKGTLGKIWVNIIKQLLTFFDLPCCVSYVEFINKHLFICIYCNTTALKMLEYGISLTRIFPYNDRIFGSVLIREYTGLIKFVLWHILHSIFQNGATIVKS